LRSGDSDRRLRALASNQAAQGPAFTATWTQLSNPSYAPPAVPYARAWTEMTWETLRQRMVIFGGNDAPSGYGNDIWSYDSATTHSGLWTGGNHRRGLRALRAATQSL
jgi:hypothetical protein